MKAVVQRVKKASVSVEGNPVGKINNGLLVYLGVSSKDTVKEVLWLADKIINLRIFGDDEGKMNLSILDIIAKDIAINSAKNSDTGILVISQFTLLGDCIKGRRPYFGEAADPEMAKPLYDLFIKKISEQVKCEAGVFRAHMEVDSVNDGPITIIIDTADLLLND